MECSIFYMTCVLRYPVRQRVKSPSTFRVMDTVRYEVCSLRLPFLTCKPSSLLAL